MGTTESLQAMRPLEIEEALSDLRGRSSDHCDAEWGVRKDDNALVFHFFPPGYAAHNATEWRTWSTFRDALERAILACFGRQGYRADYVPELSSFCLIVKPVPAVPDLTALIEQFFSLLEASS